MSELIAEARVLVTPDTTTFRSLLVAQVNAAAKGVTVPVSVTPSVTNTAAVSQAAAIAGAQSAQQSIQRLGTTAATTSGVLAQLARAEQQVELGAKRAAAATTEVSAAQITYRAAITAAATTLAAYNKALTTTDGNLIKVARESLVAARANEALALSELEVAKARAAAGRNAATQSAQLGQLSRGAGSAALAFLGLRGATLAAGGAFLTGAAAIVAFGKSLQTASQLETSLNVFQATTDATADQMERIREVSINLGRDLTLPGVTANSAADALSQLSRAGLNVQNSIAGVRGTLQLATAAAIDNETAVTLVAGALNAFQLSGRDATKVADLLAASSKESQGSIVDMGLALQQSAAAAAQAGVSVEDTIALLTQLGRAGLRGSDAGTSLRVALLRLIAPSKEARAALEGIGVAVRDVEGNVRPEVFAEITSQLSRLGKAQRDATLAMIFGQDAFRAAAIIGREGARGLSEMREATQEQGVAAELAAARTQGLAGSIENLKNQFQDLGRGIGEGASGPVGDLVDIFAGGIQNINTFIGFLDDLGDATPRAQKSISELADEFERLNREAGGNTTHAEAVARVKELGEAAAVATLDFLDLVQEAGKMNRALSEREGIEQTNQGLERNVEVTKNAGRAGDDLRREVEDLNAALEGTQSAALQARDGIEDFRAGITQAARDTQAAINAIAPPDGFLLPTPQFTAAPLEPGTRLEGDATIAAAEGNLRELLRIQKIQRDAARKAFAESKGDSEERTRLFNEMRAAEAAVISTQKQITAQQEAAAKTAQADAEQAARSAQQEFLARQANARAQQQNRIAQAEQTKGLGDDIAAQRAYAALLSVQITAIQNSALTEAQKRDAIQALVSASISTTGAIKNLVRTQEEQREANRQAIHERTQENAALRTQIAESRGNKDAVLAFLDEEIRLAQLAVKRAKKAGKGILAAQAEVERLKRKKRDLLEETKEDLSGGKSLAEFLTENTDLFNSLASSGGIVGVDPFSGFDFSSSIVAATKQMQDAVKQQQTVRTQQENRLPDAIDRLIAALDRNTASASGNDSTGGVITNGGMTYANITGQRAKALGDFWQARMARQLEGARFDGGQAT